jgi:hypothetical protein
MRHFSRRRERIACEPRTFVVSGREAVPAGVSETFRDRARSTRTSRAGGELISVASGLALRAAQ